MQTPIRLSGFIPDDCVRSLGADATVYVVGGAVRDELLGIASSDRDWVVTGATPERMVAAGFTPVGADFPVFLHPVTHEEYALARTERKTAAGYRGFTFHAAPDVTLEADLQRRDLTVNAMAMSADGQLHDPWGGLPDLQARVLRHVSPAFAEDPVRILRLARFAARFSQFSVHDETLAFCRQMVVQGEAKALVAERVWQEISRLLMSDSPAQGWRVLVQCGALPDLLPAGALEALSNPAVLDIVQSPQIMPGALPTRWAAWMLNAGLNLEGLDALAVRWRVPGDCAELAQLCVTRFAQWMRATDAAAMAEVFALSDLYRRAERFAQAVAVMDAVANSTDAAMFGAGTNNPAYPPKRSAAVWLQLAEHVKALAVGPIAKDAAARGVSVPDAVAAARVAALEQALNDLPAN